MNTTRKRRVGLGTLASSIVTVLAADLLLLTVADATSTVRLADALQEYRGGGRSESPSTTTPVAAATSGNTESAAAAAAASGPTTQPKPVASVGRPLQPQANAATPSPFSEPLAGVYAYATKGGESASMGGAEHTYPDETYAVITSKGACRWQFEHRLVEEHVDRQVLCSRPGAFELFEIESSVKFFGQSAKRGFRCDPPQIWALPTDLPGLVRETRCQSDKEQAVVRIETVGREPVTVGDVTVEAFRVRAFGRISGESEGTTSLESWLHPQTGLMLRGTRAVETTTDFAGGKIRYRENVSFELKSLEPRR